MKKLAILLILLVMSFSGCIQGEDSGDSVACPADAKICPDGSTVTRVPPDCEFAVCPEVEPEIETVTIVIDDYQFTPRNVTIEKGTTVIWTNNDTRTHSIGSSKIGSSGTMQPGESWNYTFNQEGSFKYICTFHFQKGWVTVT